MITTSIIAVWTVLVIAVMQPVASQPSFQAPLLPQVNFINSNNDSNVAVVNAATVPGFAFFADVDSLYGHRTDVAPNQQVPYVDALPGVTQLWSHCSGSGMSSSNCTVVAVAGSVIALYRIHQVKGPYAIARITVDVDTTFDMIGPGRPAIVRRPTSQQEEEGPSTYMFVIGSHSTATSSSTVMLQSILAPAKWCGARPSMVSTLPTLPL